MSSNHTSQFASILRAPLCRCPLSRLCVREDCSTRTAAQVQMHPNPRGPRSGPSCSVSVHHHLIGPIRPTRRQLLISPLSGLYVRRAGACLRRPPTTGSELSLALLSVHAVVSDPGDSIGCMYPVPSPTALAFVPDKGTRLSQYPRHPLQAGEPFRGYSRSHLLRPARLLASFGGSTESEDPATETFTPGLPTAWSPSPPPGITTVPTGRFAPAGLSPARRAASFAAPVRWF